MRLERLSQQNQHLFPQAFALYESAFPEEERRPMEEQQRVLQKEAYHVDFIMEQDAFQGIMLYWETEDLIFLEHFTTLPQLRHCQRGGGFLQ